MPAKGIAAHFTVSGKASLSRGGSVAGSGKAKPRTKAATRSRLRTPDAGEVERIMAETPTMSVTEVIVPVPTALEEERVALLGAPSPKLVAASGGALASPSKRKATKSPLHPASPSKTSRIQGTNTPRQLITGEPELPGTIEEDGLVLTPGRTRGTRIALGSPHKSPLARDPSISDQNLKTIEATLRTVSQEQDEENYLTPRSVRQRPKGLTLPPHATQTAAAIFQSGHRGDAKPVPQSSSTAPQAFTQPSLPQTIVKEESEAPLPDVSYLLSPDLPLPEYYASLIKLHEALEHALVFQLATAGCSSASLQKDSESESASDEDDLPAKLRSERKSRHSSKTIRLPNLITYSVLRPRVEQSGKRRLGPTELKRLASVWLNFPNSSTSMTNDTVDEVKGLGLLVTKTRTEDPSTGRKIVDWGIGIELEIKRVHRDRTPPPQLGFGGLASASSSPIIPSAATFDPSTPGTPKAPTRFATPPPSGGSSTPSFSRRPPSSPSLHRSPAGKSRPSVSQIKAREGMSVVAMWSNGLEVRKTEVARRLRERCARYHQQWLDSQGIPVEAPLSAVVKKEEVGPLTPVLDQEQDKDDERKAIMGAGGLWTPSATRSGGHRAGKRIITLDSNQLDQQEDDDARSEEEPGSLLSTLPASYTQGRQALKDEVESSLVRTPIARTHVANISPPQGGTLQAWHPNFDLNDPSVVKPVPLAELPSLTEPQVLGISGSGAILATPRRNKELFGLGIGNLSTPRKPVKFSQVTLPDVNVTPSSSVAAMRERLAAKETLRKSQSMSSLPNGSKTAMQNRKAIMPRLEDVSRILFMLFSNGTTRSSSGVWMSPRKPMSEVLDTLSRSLNLQFSRIECREAVNVLSEIAPGFLVVFQADANDQHQWVKMGLNTDGQPWSASQVKHQIDQVQGR